MNKGRIPEIREASGLLWKRIQSKKDEIASMEIVLRALQGGCDHPGVFKYRDQLTGKCPTCLCDFPSREQIDAKFALLNE